MMRVLSLFAGIGGFDLGLERTGGFRTVAFCEIDPFCRRVLARHWPEVPCYDDVRSLTAERLHTDGIEPDVICGGFPCQDISFAGAGAGIDGERSGLWREFARLIGDIRPRYVLVENVAALLVRGLDRVLGDLAALGYDAEWHCIPASASGAPHQRDRVWILAYPQHVRCAEAKVERSLGARTHASQGAFGTKQSSRPGGGAGRKAAMGHAHGEGEPTRSVHDEAPIVRSVGGRSAWWNSEPDMDRVVDGLPDQVDRLRALGNSVVPQVVTAIGHAILAAVQRQQAAA